MKTYSGVNQGIGGQDVFLQDGRRLKHIVRHSPDGFQWGYGGSGPSDLSLAILADCVGLERAEKWYIQFKAAFIATAGMELYITEAQILAWLEMVESGRPA